MVTRSTVLTALAAVFTVVMAGPDSSGFFNGRCTCALYNRPPQQLAPALIKLI